jgi:hypothetical protein
MKIVGIPIARAAAVKPTSSGLVSLDTTIA